MTFNLRTAIAADGPNHWDLRKDLALRVIRTDDPDLLGVQEPTAGQWAELAAALGGGRTAIGHSRQDTHGREPHWQGLFYRTARFFRVADGIFWLSDTPRVPGSITWKQDWGARACVWARLTDRTTGRDLVFAVVHTDTAGEAWLPSVQVLSAELRGIAGDLPLVLAGDFNCAGGCEAHRWITGPGGFADAWYAAGRRDEGVTTFNAFFPIPALPLDDLPRLEKWMHDTCDAVPQFAHYPAHVLAHRNYRIDWILTRGGLKTHDARVDLRTFGGRTPSDHYPVIAELEVA